MINFKPRADETVQPAAADDVVLFLDTDGSLKIKDDADLVTSIATSTEVESVARPYKVYTALLSQTGTNAPTALVLENTLGVTLTWARNGVGKYYAFAPTGSNVNNTFVMINNSYVSPSPTPPQIVINGNFYVEDEAIFINTFSNGVLSDNILSNIDIYNKTSIEIRVYN